MAIQKLFSVTAKNQLQLVALLMKENQRLVLLLFLTFRVLRNPSREFWIATTLKLLKNLFNEPTPLILFPAMTVTTNTSDRPKLVWYTFERASKSGFLLQRIKIYRDNDGLLPDAHFHLVGKKTSELHSA